ncbi:SpoIIE family protein phosphatase [Streptomyces mirabilis]|uniref:SpoIIE family protein phosphatase n=1 Tax=Streptomyces mirabilis TaxID=68239 RepID=UPI00331ABC3C
MGAQSAGLVITDLELRVLRSNVRPSMFGGRALSCGSLVPELFAPEDMAEVEDRLRRVVDEGGELANWQVPSPMPTLGARTSRPCFVSLNVLRLKDEQATPIGLVLSLTDVSEQWHAHHRLELLHRAADQIGSSLDVSRTSQDLADLLVPSLADLCAVFLFQSVLVGEVASAVAGLEHNPLLCAAVSSQRAWPETLISPGAVLPALPGTEEVLRVLRDGDPVVLDREEHEHLFEDHPDLRTLLIPCTERSQLSAPLFARGKALGSVVLWRTDTTYPFDAEDSRLVREIASRAALSVDNARRFTREHRAAITLQYSLLPLSSTRAAAARTAGVYVPASGAAGGGGDWFDVIPLSSTRMALVTGDAIGHGVQAATMMGRLRAAVRTLANLDLPPDELLTSLDDLVQQSATEATRGLGEVGATCLYMIYDPVTARCAMASAGHPPPVVARSDGKAVFLGVSAGPPLGVGGIPFEITEAELEPDSVVALYADGLVYQDGGDIKEGMEQLRTALFDARRTPAIDLDEQCRRIVARLTPVTARDDVALLLAHTFMRYQATTLPVGSSQPILKWSRRPAR